ncbi:Chemotaxis response regulator protein-glutamate methylesterase CheB [hydrothermal vent metagenome]|uniref:protein-glutamate methylesterase n=1 Tax=hydrothermal vent metagenome TaxID=652676 RepID=A0A3B0YWR2_9ZZZZ
MPPSAQAAEKRKIRVLIVDDSALIRQMLTEMLEQDPQIEVVGTAQDPFMARDKIKLLKPDVLTLDVEMPKMDGVTFLRNLMKLRPMPVVMVSTLTQKGSDITLDALELGAVDFVSKPTVDIAHSLGDYAEEIISKVKMASLARVRELKPVTERNSADVVLPVARGKHFTTTDKLIALGASTGGTEAIREVLEMMPADSPAMVISQHIPEAFSKPFSERMNRCSQMTVSQAEDGEQILPGHAYIAPGDSHLMVIRDGARFRCKLSDGPQVNRHRPSVDVMFRSVAQNVGPNAVSVLLTGMGKDGAQGMLEMRDAGSYTLVQDEASSVVWGMPGEAVALDAADEQVALQSMAARIQKALLK